MFIIINYTSRKIGTNRLKKILIKLLPILKLAVFFT